MSDDAEIARALAELTARQTTLEAQLQARRDGEAEALAKVRHDVEQLQPRADALEGERAKLQEAARVMELERRVVLGFTRRGWRVVQQVLRAALVGSGVIGLMMLGGLEPVPGLLTFAVTFGGGWLAWRLGDAADHLELQ